MTTSCSDSDDNNTPDQNDTGFKIAQNGAYVLISGGKGNNAASLSYYNSDTQKVEHGVFKTANGSELGDTGEDMIIYGNKAYVGVYNSGVIYVVDKNTCKVLSTIQGDSEKIQPRQFAAHNGKVYVTLYEGYVARIDTITLAIDSKIKVGSNPEGIEVVNSKVYVANSGGLVGYTNTMSVIDLNLTLAKEVEVGLNPQDFSVDKYNNLYLVSRGNYKTVPKQLQQINTSTDEVSVIYEGDYAFSVFPDGDKLYMMSKNYVNSVPTSLIQYYDIPTKKIVEESFIKDDTSIPDISTIQFEPKTGDIYVIAANKKNNGDVYVFSSDGKLKTKFDAGGSYPQGIWFVNK